MGAFGSWAEVIDRTWQQGAQRPAHLAVMGMGPSRRGLSWCTAGMRRISCPCFTCCGSAGGTLGSWGLRRRGGRWTRLVWRKVGNGRGGLCGRRPGRRVTDVRKRCPKDCVIWRRGRWGIGHRRVWSGAIGSCGGGRGWGWFGRSTTCWRCCKSRGCSTKPPETKRYRYRQVP